MFGHVEIVGWPCFEVVHVLFTSHGDDQIGLFPIDFVENFVEGEPHLVSVVIVELIHVEGEVRKHVVVKLIEVWILSWVLAVDLSKDVAEDHENSIIIEHTLYLFISLLAREKMKGLSNRN